MDKKILADVPATHPACSDRHGMTVALSCFIRYIRRACNPKQSGIQTERAAIAQLIEAATTGQAASSAVSRVRRHGGLRRSAAIGQRCLLASGVTPRRYSRHDRRQKILCQKTPRAEALPMDNYCRHWCRGTAENRLQKPLCPRDFKGSDFLPGFNLHGVSLHSSRSVIPRHHPAAAPLCWGWMTPTKKEEEHLGSFGKAGRRPHSSLS